MLTVEYGRSERRAGESAAYAVLIDGRPAARITRTGRRWRLNYGEHVLTLTSLAAARALVERFADRIVEGRTLELYEPREW